MAIMTKAQRAERPRAPHVATRRVRDDLWRVSSTTGIALGYIQLVDGAFQARRLVQGTTTLLPMGAGWSLEDALATFTAP